MSDGDDSRMIIEWRHFPVDDRMTSFARLRLDAVIRQMAINDVTRGMTIGWRTYLSASNDCFRCCSATGDIWSRPNGANSVDSDDNPRAEAMGGGDGGESPPPKNIKKIMSWQNRVELITLTLGFSNLVTFLQLGKTWIFQLEFSNLHFPTWIFQLAFSNLHFPTWIFQLNFPTWIFQLEFSN